MRRSVLVLIAVVGGALVAPPVDAQVEITTTTTTTTQPRETTTTTRPPSTTTTAKRAPATTTTRRPATTTTTAPPKTTTTIATPAPTTTSTSIEVEPLSRHSGDISPVFTWLAVLGLLSGIGLLVLQWHLTRPGREGWTL